MNILIVLPIIEFIVKNMNVLIILPIIEFEKKLPENKRMMGFC